MHVYRDINKVAPEFKDAIITIGNFDGIHIGHRQIMTRLVSEARQKNRKAVVMTFDPHPKMVLHPDYKPFYLITTVEEKVNLLEELGVDAIIFIPFSREFARMSAESFVRDLLWEKLQVHKIFIGHNYRFGNDKKGNDEYLKAFGKTLGFDVEVISAVTVDGMDVSSTRTRDAILVGWVKEAAKMLGRPYNLRGMVVAGYRRGEGLGFPTANIEPEKVLVPLRGVYAVNAEIDGGLYQGVLNIGFNPTFGNDKLSIEMHILDFNKDIYGKTVNVLFVDRIRDEVKFTGPDALIAQIEQDVSRARELLSA
jgi:riboflavin kinase/FMN adenylyltransferase